MLRNVVLYKYLRTVYFRTIGMISRDAIANNQAVGDAETSCTIQRRLVICRVHLLVNLSIRKHAQYSCGVNMIRICLENSCRT